MSLKLFGGFPSKGLFTHLLSFIDDKTLRNMRLVNTEAYSIVKQEWLWKTLTKNVFRKSIHFNLDLKTAKELYPTRKRIFETFPRKDFLSGKRKPLEFYISRGSHFSTSDKNIAYITSKGSKERVNVCHFPKGKVVFSVPIKPYQNIRDIRLAVSEKFLIVSQREKVAVYCIGKKQQMILPCWKEGEPVDQVEHKGNHLCIKQGNSTFVWTWNGKKWKPNIKIFQDPGRVKNAFNEQADALLVYKLANQKIIVHQLTQKRSKLSIDCSQQLGQDQCTRIRQYNDIIWLLSSSGKIHRYDLNKRVWKKPLTLKSKQQSRLKIEDFTLYAKDQLLCSGYSVLEKGMYHFQKNGLKRMMEFPFKENSVKFMSDGFAYINPGIVSKGDAAKQLNEVNTVLF